MKIEIDVDPTSRPMTLRFRDRIMADFSIIGILGPAGSGKDLVADWFASKGFVKVAFADPMKRFVLKAFSISEDRLWGPSEKRNEIFEVDDAWWYEVIGHFGSASEEIVQEVIPDGLKTSGYLKLHDWLSALRKTYPKEISARFILQTLGTEWGRAVDSLMWARYAHYIAGLIYFGARYDQVKGVGVERNKSEELSYRLSEIGERPLGVIIPDHRFRNEIELTHDNGGHVIRLKRLSMEKSKIVGISGHQSEAEQKEMPDNLFHAIYELPEGVDRVHKLLEDTFKDRPWEWVTTKPDLVTDGYVTVTADYRPEPTTQL